MNRNVRVMATIAFAIAVGSTAALAQKGAVGALRPVSPQVLSQYKAASGALQPAVRSWVAAQAAAFGSAGSFAKRLSALRDAARKRFAIGAGNETTTQALVFLVLIEAVRTASDEHARHLKYLSALNATAEALSRGLAALAEASSELADDSKPCESPACTRFRSEYARLFTFAPIATVGGLTQKEARAGGDLARRREELNAAAARLKQESSKIDQMKQEAAERYDHAMNAANAALVIAIAATSLQAVSAIDTTIIVRTVAKLK